MVRPLTTLSIDAGPRVPHDLPLHRLRPEKRRELLRRLRDGIAALFEEAAGVPAGAKELVLPPPFFDSDVLASSSCAEGMTSGKKIV